MLSDFCDMISVCESVSVIECDTLDVCMRKRTSSQSFLSCRIHLDPIDGNDFATIDSYELEIILFKIG